MSRRIEDNDRTVALIEATEPDKCELCGKIAELRPYGPKGKKICFSCGMKNEEATTRKCKAVLFGEVFH